MARILSLLLIFLALNGCSPAFISTPTEVTPSLETQTQLSSTTAVQIIAPTSVPITPTIIPRTQPSTMPTERSTTPSSSIPSPIAPSATAPPSFSYPIGTPGKPLGDGFFIRHGVQVENTWYNPGYWHTGEDWYAIAGDTAGANVYVIADGAVVYVGGNYPGRVVIVRHAGDLYSMYGHLDPHLKIE